MRRDIILPALALLLAGDVAASAQDAPSSKPALANPAAVLCVKNGAKIETEVAPDGGQRGVCVFPDGTRIDEWAYFRNKTRMQH